MALWTKGIQLILKEGTHTDSEFQAKMALVMEADILGIAQATVTGAGNAVYFEDLQEISEIGVNADGRVDFDQIEVTTLKDERHVYIDGLIADSDEDESELTFKLLYSQGIFGLLKDIQALECASGEKSFWAVKLPDGGLFDITATIANVALDSVSVNSPVTMTLTLEVEEIDFA